MKTSSHGGEKGKPERPLTFRGLDLCDGCGTRLEPGDRLAGLCPACADAGRGIGAGTRKGRGGTK